MSAMPGLNSLATIIKRLEAATSRLEDVADTMGAPPAEASTPNMNSRTASPNPGITASPSTRSAAAAAPPPPPPPPPLAPSFVPGEAKTPESVVAFDEIVVLGAVKPFIELTRSFAGQNVIDMAALVEKQYAALRELLLTAASCKHPDSKGLESLLAPLQAAIEAISRAKETHRRDRDWFTHITIIGEGSPGVGWVVSPKPGPYVGDVKDSVDYYANRIIKEFKEKDPKHVEWTRAYLGILEAMRKFVMEYHKTGLTWNPQGVTLEQYKAAPPASTSSSGAPPPPPPPPPSSAPAPSAAPAGGAAAVFAELNRGEDVTRGLRKVDKSEMTHKNPALRAGGVVPASTSSTSVGGGPAAGGRKPLKPSKPQALAGKKPSKFVLEGTKWLIEYYENEPALTVEEAQLNHSINLYGCKNMTVVVKGKVNAVTMVNCKKTSLLVHDVIASISITNSPSFALQITGKAPMVQVDSTDGGQVYLSSEALAADIVLTTAKCSALNVSVQVAGEEEGVFEEIAVPEMLRSVVRDGKLVTEVVEHSG